MPGASLIRRLAERTTPLLLVFLAAWLIPYFAEFPARYAARLGTLFDYVAVAAFFFQAVIWANTLVRYQAERYIDRHRVERGDATTILAVAVLIKVAFWAVLFVLALEGLGKNVAGLVTTLGVGGVAIAFALQNVLGDVFGAMSIVFDKPFVVGDAITVDSLSGTVERIGLKSTRVRSFTGEQIVFSNGELLKGRIRNFGRLQERQAVFLVRVAGDTPPGDLARVPGILRSVLEGRPETRVVYAHLKAVTDTAVDFEAVCYLTNPDYGFYMRSMEATWLALLQRLDAEGIQLYVRLQAATQEKLAGREVTPFPAPRVPPAPSGRTAGSGSAAAASDGAPPSAPSPDQPPLDTRGPAASGER